MKEELSIDIIGLAGACSYALDCIEFFFVQMIKNNLDNKLLVQKIKKDILKVQHAKKQTEAYIKPRLIFEDLFFSFLK